jgi:hypothetical protein
MRTVLFRLLSVTAIAVLTLAAVPTAQERPSGLLNSLEVRRLVARGGPGDHAQLSAHFTRLGDWYAAEAKRHLSMSQNFVVSPTRNLESGLKAHCKRLADINAQSAAIVRDLAVHHERLASGTPSTAPVGGASFEAGIGAPAPTDRELRDLAASARTAGDHLALADQFLTLSERYRAEVTRHTSMAQMTIGNPSRNLSTGMAAHCDRLVKLADEAADTAERAAALHSELAGIAR